MSIIPLHLQRQFEQRWAARVASLRGATALKNVVAKRISGAARMARAKAGPTQLTKTSVPLISWRAGNEFVLAQSHETFPDRTGLFYSSRSPEARPGKRLIEQRR